MQIIAMLDLHTRTLSERYLLLVLNVVENFHGRSVQNNNLSGAIPAALLSSNTLQFT